MAEEESKEATLKKAVDLLQGIIGHSSEQRQSKENNYA